MRKANNKKVRLKAKASNRYRGVQRRGEKESGAIVRSFRFIFQTGKIVFGGVFALSLLASVSIGLILGYHYLVNSPYFMVKRVVLQGIEKVSRVEVLEATGLDQPTSLLSIRLDEMGTRLSRLPWVDEVNLTRKLPDTIIIEIKERKAKALINLGSLYFLDEKGKAFKKVDPRDKPEAPIITGFTQSQLTAGGPEVEKRLKEVFTLLEVLTPRNDRFRLENISEINSDPIRGLSLFTKEESCQVKIGFGDYQAKIRRLGRVLAGLKISGRDENLVYFNLECGPRVIVRRAANS